jgi:glutamate dehydrogenase
MELCHYMSKTKRTSVMDQLEEKGFVPPDFIETEVQWFYKDLGIDDSYFATEQVGV